MPAPAPGAMTAGGALYDFEPWLTMGDYRKWANGGFGNVEGDFDDVRFTHLPRPQLLPFPVNAMLGEMQDVRGATIVGGHALWRPADLRHRQIIVGDALDSRGQARVLGLMARFRMPLYGRVTVEASFAHTSLRSAPMAANTSGSDVPYFSLWWGAAESNTFTEIPGTRRHVRRWAHTYLAQGVAASTTGPYVPSGDFVTTEPTVQFANILAALSTRNGTTPAQLVTGNTDLLIYVALTDPGSPCYFANGFAGADNDNTNRVEVHNTSLVVRVFKNVLN
jgi:hypothetical protein